MKYWMFRSAWRAGRRAERRYRWTHRRKPTRAKHSADPLIPVGYRVWVQDENPYPDPRYLAPPALTSGQIAELPDEDRYLAALSRWSEARTELQAAQAGYQTCKRAGLPFQTFLRFSMPEVYEELLSAGMPTSTNTVGGMSLRTRLGTAPMIVAYLSGIALFVVLYAVL